MKCENPDPKDQREEISGTDKPMVQMRPDESEESIMTPPSSEEVKESVEEINPDENSMNSRG